MPLKACCRIDNGELPDNSLKAESPSVVQPAMQLQLQFSNLCGQHIQHMQGAVYAA